MMPFEVGNQHAAGFGRPRSVDRELQRLREAAGHIDRLIEGQALASALDPAAGHQDLPRLFRLREALRRQTGEVEELAAALAEMAALRDRAEGRRRRRALGADRWTQAVASAAIALDRLVGTEDPQ